MNSELMREQAVLLTGDHPSIDDGRAGRLLEFFGIPYQMRNATDFGFPKAVTRRVTPSADSFAQQRSLLA